MPFEPNEDLIHAAARGDIPAIRNALCREADVHARRDMALIEAACTGSAEAVRVLLAAGASATARGGAALREAAIRGHIAAVQALLAAGARCEDSMVDEIMTQAERDQSVPHDCVGTLLALAYHPTSVASGLTARIEDRILTSVSQGLESARVRVRVNRDPSLPQQSTPLP